MGIYFPLRRSPHDQGGMGRFSGISDFLRNLLEDNECELEWFNTCVEQAMVDTCLARVVVDAYGGSETKAELERTNEPRTKPAAGNVSV